jgi:Fic family protein
MGFEIYRGLTVPFHRAVFMMFLISEVHPFSDGNGRVARIMMNAELIAERESRIIVPTVYRNNYLQALKALSQSAIVSPIVRALDFAQRYTAAVDFSSVDTARTMLQRTHAFDDANEAENTGIRLVLPSPEVLA